MKHTTRHILIDARQLRGNPARKPATVLRFPVPAVCPACVGGQVQRPVYCCQDASEARANLCGCLGLAVDLVLEPCACPAGVALAEREAEQAIAERGGAPSFLGAFPGCDEFPF